MPDKKKCSSCGNSFEPTKSNQCYCSRKCFKKAYYKRKKEEEKNQVTLYRCPSCLVLVTLDFHPSKNQERLDNLICPNCLIGREDILNAPNKTEVNSVNRRPTY